MAALIATTAALPLVQAADTAPAAAAASSLPPGGTLAAGQCLSTATGSFALCVQGDGNLVEYGGGRAIWTAATAGHAGTRLVNQGDGNLVLYSSAGSPLWYSGTNGRGLSTLVVQGDGNTVLYAAGGPSWHTYTNGGVNRLASSAAVAYVKRQIGKPYVYGATGPGSFDCSGLVLAAYRSAGVSLPHSAASMYRLGSPQSLATLVPGDLTFSYSGPGHVGIYVGGGTIVDAPHTGTTVRYDPVGFYGQYVGSRRVA